MITPTGGYIEHTEMRAYYYGVDSDSFFYLGFSFVTRPQPNGVRDDNKYGYKQGFRVKYNDAGGDSTFVRYHSLELSDISSSTVIYTNSPFTSWSGLSVDENKTNGQKILSKQSGVELRVDSGNLISYTTGVGGIGTTSIDAMQLVRVNDNTSTDRIEVTGNHKVSPSTYEWTPFDENESASAYVFKALAINNTLAVNSLTTESRTYPIFRKNQVQGAS